MFSILPPAGRWHCPSPPMAWTLFFKDKGDVQATTIEANYHHMGGTYATATAVFFVSHGFHFPLA